MARQYKDRFSEEENELTEKSAYTCTSCDIHFKKENAKKQVRSVEAGSLRN
ncbi:MAG: hypothetical protein PVF84_07710 [Desulfuromonadales bacterium]|jgi:hypothetical protein